MKKTKGGRMILPPSAEIWSYREATRPAALHSTLKGEAV